MLILTLWTNQRQVLWPADQSQLTWPQYSSSGPIRGEYCGQLTDHSSPGHSTHPLHQSETSIVANWPITADLFEQPHLVEDLCLDEDRLAGAGVILDNLRDLRQSILGDIMLSYTLLVLKPLALTSNLPIFWRLLLLMRKPCLSIWSRFSPDKFYF